jgi:RNA polymerase sigma-70 factor (ECF subfamily)
MNRCTQNELSDNDLLERAIRGDTKAFGMLYTRYLEDIHRYIYYKVTNRYEAEDLTETVFLKAWDALPRFKSGKVNFRAWLYRIAHNTVIDFYRTDRSSVDITAMQMRDNHPSLDEQIQIQDENNELNNAIRALESNLKQVIIYRFLNGMSHAETAQVMDLKEGNVRVLQMRALQKLRRLLEE